MYEIRFSDPIKTKTIVIPDNGVDTSTSLTLFGQGNVSYGKLFWENLLHLTENFCANTPPVKPIEGQLWYNSDTKKLSVYDGTNWISVSYNAPINTSNFISLLHADTAENLSGVDVPGDTVYSGPNKNDDHAATKAFADNWHGGVKSDSTDAYSYVLYPNKFIIITGNSSGQVTLPFEMSDVNYSAVTTGVDNYAHYIVTNKTTAGFVINTNQWLVVGLIK